MVVREPRWSIHCRLLGDNYSSKFEDLITDMELHYYDVDKVPIMPKVTTIFNYYFFQLVINFTQFKFIAYL
jgi:hypothetical protein